MKKIINEPSDFVEESIEGLVQSHPDIYSFAKDNKRVINRTLKAKNKGVRVALSIDGSKKSGNYLCDLPIPKNVFEEEIFISVGRSMLRRFQMEGQTLEEELVADRLLLNYSINS